MGSLRPASVGQAVDLWPAVRAGRLFSSLSEFEAFIEAGPWRVRVTRQGEAAVLASWRAHLDVLAIRGLWAPAARVGACATEVCDVAADHGFSSVLSPLVTLEAIEPYLACGFAPLERLVVFQGLASDVVARSEEPAAAVLRLAADDDVAAVTALDARCFDEFWHYGEPEVREAMDAERVVVAVRAGRVAGYVTCALHGAAVTIGRLAVAPEARREGVGRALVADCARWARRHEAFALSLCTQESNAGARVLYAHAGMHELTDRYTLALKELESGGGAGGRARGL